MLRHLLRTVNLFDTAKYALFLCLLAACSGRSGGEQTRSLVYYETYDPRSLDPALSTDVPTGEMVTLVFDGLTQFDPDGRILPALSDRWMDHFGEHLYNLYGSTEVAWATIATPRDLREAPGTVGKPPRGSVVKIYDEHGNPVRSGETGRIFVGNDVQFEGYTGGGNKDEIGGLLSSGDVGHFDDAGRLFIDGRDDDMIVSGGENVFPSEVEDLLQGHAAVEEAAVVGVEDADFGQRLRAFVVVRRGHELSEQEVKDHVKANLAGYKTPRDVRFVDELPRNATGKVLKRELREDPSGAAS